MDRDTPLAEAMQWVARVTAAALMMVLPGLAGQWLDRRLGWNGLALLGFAAGLVGGIGYLLVVTKAVGPSLPGRRRQSRTRRPSGEKGDGDGPT